MNRIALLAAPLFVLSTHTAAAPAPAAPLTPSPAHAETALTSVELLSRHHYKAQPLDDALSQQIFERYLKALDPNRLFLLQADIDEFAFARTTLDDAIRAGRLDLPFALFARYTRRTNEQMNVIRALLDTKFDFSLNETYTPDRSEAPWAASTGELREIWRKRIKNDWLRLRLGGMNDAAIRTTLSKRYEHALDRAARFSSDEVFQTFMNAWASALEPHTSYLGPRAAEDFAISMKLSLVGIGAVLQERDDYVTVRELIAGGPALRSGKIEVGDRIVGVAQGDGPMVDVTGWRANEVVNLIRGAANTTVVLDLLPAGIDDEHHRVTLVRATIRLENQAAKSEIREIHSSGSIHRIGVIKLPSFYQDSEARRRNPGNFRSATRDTAQLIEQLKHDGIDALLLDLRNNAGGVLDEAVSLTGLFIDSGPVVIQHNARGQMRIERDLVAGMAWDGPLAVLINRASASASEIFAAAIQDYGRGIIIGEDSFGKGTVQTLIDLDEIARSKPPRYGELKLTVAQFFRISGGTTQLRGVTPDIALPSLSDTEHFGEASYDNALPWTRIGPAEYHSVGNIAALLPELNVRHEQRVAKDAGFHQLQEDAEELKAMRQRRTISLNEARRRAEYRRQEARAKIRNQLLGIVGPDGADLPDNDDGLFSDERSLSVDLAAEKARKTVRDVLLDEGASILGDMIELLATDSELARNVSAEHVSAEQ
ncbi:MAG: carboxy terminal-processing peptidase [Azoarcus sp.]|nr:carboxy terminal-processing peptidase [Azoarcus sp.]